MQFPIIENSYRFECTCCGNCCTGDQEVFLNPYDLFKMARYKGYSHTKRLFDEYLVHLVRTQNKAWLPQIIFKSLTKRKLKTCPFLINELDEFNNLKGLCSLHPIHKPLICHMAPVGRILDFKANTEQYIYVKPAPDCPGVHSKKINMLHDLIGLKRPELDYEKRFMKLLDHISFNDPPEIFYLEHFYHFDVNLPFNQIINFMEETLN